MKWYKRDPQAALLGMATLTLEERGAYNTILDLIYAHNNRLVDDDKFISGQLNCDVRVWKRIKIKLVSLEKIILIDGRIANDRANLELTSSLPKPNLQLTYDEPAGNLPPQVENVSNNINELQPLDKNRIDKIRKEYKPPISPSEFLPPDWVPRIDWDDFVEFRKQIKKPMTFRAMELTIKDLVDLKARGDPPDKVLQQSIKKNWAGVFKLVEEKSGGRNYAKSGYSDIIAAGIRGNAGSQTEGGNNLSTSFGQPDFIRIEHTGHDQTHSQRDYSGGSDSLLQYSPERTTRPAYASNSGGH